MWTITRTDRKKKGTERVERYIYATLNDVRDALRLYDIEIDVREEMEDMPVLRGGDLFFWVSNGTGARYEVRKLALYGFNADNAEKIERSIRRAEHSNKLVNAIYEAAKGDKSK